MTTTSIATWGSPNSFVQSSDFAVAVHSRYQRSDLTLPPHQNRSSFHEAPNTALHHIKSKLFPHPTIHFQVVLEDNYGDGWVDALPDRANTWALTQALSSEDIASPVADGTLPDRHLSGTTQLCLEDGLYTFSTTADAAWSEESSWTVCGVTGGAGGALDFEVKIWFRFSGMAVGCGSGLWLVAVRGCGGSRSEVVIGCRLT